MCQPADVQSRRYNMAEILHEAVEHEGDRNLRGGATTDSAHRELGYAGFNWDDDNAVKEDASTHVGELKDASEDLRASARQHEVAGELDIAAVLDDKAAILDDTAVLVTQKADLMSQRKALLQAQADQAEQNGVSNGDVDKVISYEEDVLKINIQMSNFSQQMKVLEEQAKISEEYMKQKNKYEKIWQKAIEALGVTEEEFKSVGKVEHALNLVVAWFTGHFGCELGVVVTRML